MTKQTGSIRDNARAKSAHQLRIVSAANSQHTPKPRLVAKTSAARTSTAKASTAKASAAKVSAAPRLKLQIEMRHLRDMGDIRGQWTALAARALEPNAFYEPAFTEAACLHLPHERNVAFVLVWAAGNNGDEGEGQSLLGLFPVAWPRWPVLPSEVKGWNPDLAAHGAPLVDTVHAEAVITSYLDWLGQRGPRCATTMLPQIDLDGPFAQALRRVTERTGRNMSLFGTRERATIMPVSSGTLADQTTGLTAARARLEAKGPVTITATETPREVRDAIEAFMALESNAARKRSDTLLGNAATATFTRAMLRKFAQSGRCRIHMLYVGDQLIAGIITMKAGGQSWVWRTAEAKSFTKDQPTAVLLAHIAEHGEAGARFVLPDLSNVASMKKTDTHASATMRIADCLIATGRGPSTAAMAVLARETANRSLRGFASSALRIIQGGRA